MVESIPTQELIQILAQRLGKLKERKCELELQLEFKIALLQQQEKQGKPVGSSAASYAEEEDDDDELCKDLFTNARAHPSQVIDTLLTKYKFDLVSFCKQLSHQGDHLAMARTINYIRTQVAKQSGDNAVQILAQVAANADNWQQDETFLKPFLPNDSLLWGDSFSDDEDFDGEEVAEDDDDDDEEDDDASSQSSVDSYFGGYDSIDIHEEMLRDEIRTLSYRDAFANSKQQVFQGNTVIDVGSGTGILSMLCSKYGEAKMVHAIENCRTLSKMSRKLMHKNGFRENKIQLFVGLAQEFAVKNPQVKVDAVISEWMGYALLFEHQMLSAVLQVRDQTLKPGGRMFPNKSRLLVHAIGDSDNRLNYWDSVYGLDFSLMKELRRARVDVMVVDPSAILSPAAVFKEFDFETMKDEELDFEAEFEVTPTGNNVVVVEGLCISFDCSFPADVEPSLDTSPEVPATHWKQSVLWFDEKLLVTEGESIRGVITYIRKGPSRLDIGLKVNHPKQFVSIYEM